MSRMLTDDEIAELVPSELLPHHTPIPTQVVSSDEFYPDSQNPRQREVEARLLAMDDELGKRQGIDRRRLFSAYALPARHTHHQLRQYAHLGGKVRLEQRFGRQGGRLSAAPEPNATRKTRRSRRGTRKK
jgi:hypothetical protein